MSKRLSSFATNRPVAILMLFLAAVVFGYFSLERLPVTLMPELTYPTVTVRTKKQARHIYDDAVEGIVMAIQSSLDDGFLPEGSLDDLVMVVNAFVHPSAANRRRITINNYKAMRAALRKAIEGRPTVEETLHEKEAARHPLRYAP